MPKALFRQSFSTRLSALRAIADRNPDRAEDAARELKLVSANYGKYSPGEDLLAFSTALSCLALQWRWFDAVRNAESDAIRYQKAAKLKADEYLESDIQQRSTLFDRIIREISEVTKSTELKSIEANLASISLPFSVTHPDNRRTLGGHVGKEERKPTPEIAFVKFDINGDAAKTIDTLSPNTAHDIDLHIRVTNWPEHAERLIVEPISMEPGDFYEIPKFVITKPKEAVGPITFTHEGRLILKVAQPVGARPFEIKYRAVFDPLGSGYVDLVGHRTLKLESLDPAGTALSGYSKIDTKLLEIRRQLITMPGSVEADILSTMTLLYGLGNLAGQALQASLFSAGTREAEFQNEVEKHLRSRTDIGSELERHPHVGGGITDLSFRQIRLEMKAEPSKKLSSDDLSKFADQSAQYIIATGKNVGMLCILDSRPKKGPPAPAETYFSVQLKHINSASIAVVTIVIQGGLARPSDLSR